MGLYLTLPVLRGALLRNALIAGDTLLSEANPRRREHHEEESFLAKDTDAR